MLYQRLPLSKLFLRCLLLLMPILLIAAFKKDLHPINITTILQNGLDTEENRFNKVVLAERLDEPLDLAILKGGKVLFIERKGNIKLYDPAAKTVSVVATIPVSTKYTDKQGKKSEAEDGLLGITLDPKYYVNHWIYLYYSPAGDASENILTRYVYWQGKLNLSSKKILLHVGTQREQCCHTGGKLDWDAQDNLYLTTGDNSSPRSTVYSPSDERPGRSPWDAQKSAANTNDLRGKILRIHPEADGTYIIPDGNLFPKGTPKTRPEIYVMGLRNPYTLFVDKHTGYVYWGEVGPDAAKDSIGRGPMSYDEWNIAKKPGFFGWPYFVGNSQAYNKFDFATGTSGPLWNPNKPINTSPNNTGLTELPPTQSAFIWYSYGASKEFPLLGAGGGRCAMGGPFYRAEDYKTAARPFPQYYDGKWFIFEWIRDWIEVVSMDKDGNYKGLERFMPHSQFSHPMAMRFGSDGDMYVLEYGQGWFMQNDDSKLVRIEYTAGSRKPVVAVAADKTAGSLPLTVNFTSAGTMDYDNSQLAYRWKVTSASGVYNKTFTVANPSITFGKPGTYNAVLMVTNAKGLKSNATVQVIAGNEPPQVNIDIVKGNKSFYLPGKPFNYVVKVTDKEDGVAGKNISARNVNISIDYLKDLSLVEPPLRSHRPPKDATGFSAGKVLIGQNDCKSCHAPEKKIIGPSYVSISQKYKNDLKAYTRLPNKIINGGTGVWGDIAMAAHPQLSKADAQEIVKYILSIAKPKPAPLPLIGSYTPKLPDSGKNAGVVVINASYTDKGFKGVPRLNTQAQLILMPSNIKAGSAKASKGISKFFMPGLNKEMVIVMANNSNFYLNNLDLNGLDSVTFNVMAPREQLYAQGGRIEIHLDSATGTL
ncbi:MAG TPA: PQQ-dependent sugar dehydrogenase, partial [Mucilaginibacter sp.]|nr:PQQ-dependent sugar dehydrogenase [Mucilaginibacter sp.]